MNVTSAGYWVCVALVGSSVVGYAFGFWAARPAVNPLAIVGAVAVLIALIALAAKGRALIKSRSPQISRAGQSSDAKLGLLWTGVAILACINIGAFLGFTIGFHTAEGLMKLLSGAGVVALLVALAAAIVAIASRRRSGIRWNRRR